MSGSLRQSDILQRLFGRRGDTIVNIDEHPQLSPLQAERIRNRFSREAMAKLRTIFKKDGTVTAANASGINDGAGAMVMTTAAIAEARGLQPIGRLIAGAAVGVEPRYMGIGPVAAIRKALENLGRHEGLIKTYDRPFTPDNHDALNENDYIMVRFEGNTVVPVLSR